MWVEGRAGVAQAEDPARAVRRRHLEEEIGEAKKRKTTYTAVTVFCMILAIVALIPPIIEFTDYGMLVSGSTPALLVGAIIMIVLTMICAYLSEQEKKRTRELEIERARLE